MLKQHFRQIQGILQQLKTEQQLQSHLYQLTGTEVWYTGNGLNNKATIYSMNNSTKGQVIIQSKAEITWRQVTIKVTSTLSATQAGGRRLLFQTTYDPVYGETDQIECIKAEGVNRCPTCEEEEAANGYSSDNCIKGSNSNGYILAADLLTLLLMV